MVTSSNLTLLGIPIPTNHLLGSSPPKHDHQPWKRTLRAIRPCPNRGVPGYCRSWHDHSGSAGLATCWWWALVGLPGEPLHLLVPGQRQTRGFSDSDSLPMPAMTMDGYDCPGEPGWKSYRYRSMGYSIWEFLKIRDTQQWIVHYYNWFTNYFGHPFRLFGHFSW